MAQKYLVQVVDDLDGTELEQDDAEQIAFSLDGTAYLIDLSGQNADTLRETLRPYVDAARRDGANTAQGSTATRKNGAKPEKRNDLDEIRAWANANGRSVSSRGRVPAAILDAYDAAH